MRNQIVVPVPPELEIHRDDLQYFVETMVRKLHVNRHKDGNDFDVNDAFVGLCGELRELGRALGGEGQFETYMEAVDVANMAWITGRKAIGYDKETWVTNQKDRQGKDYENVLS